MVQRLQVRVIGRVQGVGYRAHTAAEARRLGVAGWVKNLADGSVELEAEGPRAAVEALVAWCRTGPRLAHVERVEVAPRQPTGEVGFRVLR